MFYIYYKNYSGRITYNNGFGLYSLMAYDKRLLFQPQNIGVGFN